MNTLTTIALCWIAASYVIAVAVPADQLRRSPSEWEAAGRDRRFWVMVTLIMGFHGLGPYAAAAYFVNVRPRLRAVEQRPAPRPGERTGDRVAARWRSAASTHAASFPRRAEARTAAEELAIVAALLVFAASLIHASVTSGHFAEYWPFGILFTVVSILQAIWAAQVYAKPLDPRLLLAGAVGNAALIVVWAISRTTGLPFGPHPGEPEPVGPADVMAAVDGGLSAIVVAAMLVCMRRRVGRLPGAVLQLVIALAGAVWLYSVMAPFATGNAH